jgi:hypothetical protein
MKASLSLSSKQTLINKWNANPSRWIKDKLIWEGDLIRRESDDNEWLSDSNKSTKNFLLHKI